MPSGLCISVLNLTSLILYQSIFLFVVLSFFVLLFEPLTQWEYGYLFSFTLEIGKGTQLSKQTSSKRVRTKHRGIQSGEKKAVSPSFVMTLSWGKKKQNWTKCAPESDSQT